MIPKKLVSLFVVGSILALTACSALQNGIPLTSGIETSGANDSLANTHWRLMSYGEPGAEAPVLEGTEVTLQFEEGSQAVGSGGCNTFGAKYEVTGENSLSITKVASTLMSCSEENLMEQEKEYFEALSSAEDFEISGNSLIVHYGGGQGVLNFSMITTNIPNSVYL